MGLRSSVHGIFQVKKAEHRRIEAFELWCWRRLLRVPWTARSQGSQVSTCVARGSASWLSSHGCVDIRTHVLNTLSIPPYPPSPEPPPLPRPEPMHPEPRAAARALTEAPIVHTDGLSRAGRARKLQETRVGIVDGAQVPTSQTQDRSCPRDFIAREMRVRPGDRNTRVQGEGHGARDRGAAH